MVSVQHSQARKVSERQLPDERSIFREKDEGTKGRGKIEDGCDDKVDRGVECGEGGVGDQREMERCISSSVSAPAWGWSPASAPCALRPLPRFPGRPHVTWGIDLQAREAMENANNPKYVTE